MHRDWARLIVDCDRFQTDLLNPHNFRCEVFEDNPEFIVFPKDEWFSMFNEELVVSLLVPFSQTLEAPSLKILQF